MAITPCRPPPPTLPLFPPPRAGADPCPAGTANSGSVLPNLCVGTCSGDYVQDGLFCVRPYRVVVKASYGRGAGTLPVCRSGLLWDAGLCYFPCDSGKNFTAVGPVCWMQCPADKSTDYGALCCNSAR